MSSMTYRIYQALVRKSWKPADLARALGVSRSYVSGIIGGKYPATETMKKVAELLEGSGSV